MTNPERPQLYVEVFRECPNHGEDTLIFYEIIESHDKGSLLFDTLESGSGSSLCEHCKLTWVHNLLEWPYEIVVELELPDIPYTTLMTGQSFNLSFDNVGDLNAFWKVMWTARAYP